MHCNLSASEILSRPSAQYSISAIAVMRLSITTIFLNLAAVLQVVAIPTSNPYCNADNDDNAFVYLELIGPPGSDPLYITAARDTVGENIFIVDPDINVASLFQICDPESPQRIEFIVSAFLAQLVCTGYLTNACLPSLRLILMTFTVCLRGPAQISGWAEHYGK